MNSTPNAAFSNIKASHVFSGDVKGLQDYYENWSSNYNKDLQEQNWVAPDVTCSIVDAAATAYFSGPIRVLDAGCGTGLVGLGLKIRGYDQIDGIDLCENMVKLARKTGSYRNLYGSIDLNKQDDPVTGERYDLVVSSGMFTLGHVDPIAVLSLIKYCKDDGLVIVSTRASYEIRHDFKTFLEQNVFNKIGTLEFCVRSARYIAEEPGHYWAIRKRARTG